MSVAGVVAGWLALSPLILASSAMAQDAAPPSEPPLSAQPMPVQPAPVPPVHKPGLFEAFGRWVDRGVADFQDHMRGAKRKMDDLNGEAAANSKTFGSEAAAAGKNAAEAVTKLPTARMIDGRERCAIAPNGAPDCLAAAEVLCRKHGYATGKSMDFTSAEECPVKTLLGQQSRQECRTVTFISRAMCQ
jgi:hypothetical protein